MTTYEEPELVGPVSSRPEFAEFADSLPKPKFQWRALNVHVPGGLATEAEIAQMAAAAREMNFTAVLFAATCSDGCLLYNTSVGEKAPRFDHLDHLASATAACHQQGLPILVQFFTFLEGSGENPSKFIREYPEYADWNPGDGPDISKHAQVFGCPDRPEVRAYELALIREICENYDVDGISFDYIRYKNDRWCVCPYSERKFTEYRAAHPQMSDSAARAQMAEETIVSFTWEVRELLDEIRPGLLLHGYVHPNWANKFPLSYLSFRASAHGAQPGRGGPWSLEQVYEAAQHNVALAGQHVDYMKAAPMADTGYSDWAKRPERFRRELRLIYRAGARDIMIYLYATLRDHPELRELLTEELAE